MWIRIFILGLLFLIQCIDSKNEDQEKTNDKKEFIERCISASSNKKNIRKIQNFFSLKLDNIESEGIAFYFTVSNDEIVFWFMSQPEPKIIPLMKVDENIFQTEREKVYLGIKFDAEDNEEYVWLEKSKNALFKDYEMIGKTDRKETPHSCLNREKFEAIYSNRKAEIEAGPEPNHYIGIGQGFHTINRDSVIMRDAPSIQGRFIQTLRRGQTVAVIDHASQEMRIDPFGTSHWLKIRLENNKIGYIFGTFVEWKESFPPNYNIDDP